MKRICWLATGGTIASRPSENGLVPGFTAKEMLEMVPNLNDYGHIIRVDAKADVVYITDTGTKYHRATCRTLKKNKYEITKEEAIEQGYTACKVCNPGN